MYSEAQTELSLFIRKGDIWRVATIGRTVLEAKVEREEDKSIPPLKGWQYLIPRPKRWQHWVKDKWRSDPTFMLSREVSSGCTEVIVELKGKYKEKYPALAGTYLPVKVFNRGRRVGSY